MCLFLSLEKNNVFQDFFVRKGQIEKGMNVNLKLCWQYIISPYQKLHILSWISETCHTCIQHHTLIGNWSVTILNHFKGNLSQIIPNQDYFDCILEENVLTVNKSIG